MCTCHDYATGDEIAAYLKTRNWVIARRTPRILQRYGEDVLCLTQQNYTEMQRRILLARTEGFD